MSVVEKVQAADRHVDELNAHITMIANTITESGITVSINPYGSVNEGNVLCLQIDTSLLQ